MASKSGQEAASTEQVEELLDAVDSTLDRLKTLYEQYFLGIQKQAPAFIHSDVERKLRDLTQLNIRNTGLRYRLATLQQKFGSYNSYWRRTLRQIENGTYARNLAKIGREAARTGSHIPEEILAAMPKRMREQVLRDRDQALAIAKRRQQVENVSTDDEMLTFDEAVHVTDAPPARDVKTASGAHVLTEADADIDFNELFSAFDDDAPKADTIGQAPRSKQPTAQPARAKVPSTQPAPRPPLPRMPVPSTSNPPLGSPAQRSSTPTPPGASTTTAIPRPVGQPSSGPVHATGPIPIATAPATQTSAIPRPVGHQPSGPAQGVPRPPGANQTGPTQAVPQPVGQQPSSRTQGIPRPPGASQTGPTQAVPQPVGHQASGPAQGVPGQAGQSGSGPTQGIPRAVGQQGSQPSTAMPRPPGTVPATSQTGPVPIARMQTGPVATGPRPPITAQTGPVPVVPRPGPGADPGGPGPTVTQSIPRAAPSQQARPTPVTPGAAAQTGPVPVESMSGPFPRTPSENPAQTTQIPRPQTTQIPRPAPPTDQTGPMARAQQISQIPRAQQTSQIPRAQQTSQIPKSQQTQAMPKAPLKPPPGMTDADVNALHAKYVKAKEAIGEKVDAGSREKLLKTINQTAPKIMEQYKASGVDFSVVVKDNQVVIKAKPKT